MEQSVWCDHTQTRCLDRLNDTSAGVDVREPARSLAQPTTHTATREQVREQDSGLSMARFGSKQSVHHAMHDTLYGTGTGTGTGHTGPRSSDHPTNSEAEEWGVSATSASAATRAEAADGACYSAGDNRGGGGGEGKAKSIVAELVDTQIVGATVITAASQGILRR